MIYDKNNRPLNRPQVCEGCQSAPIPAGSAQYVRWSADRDGPAAGRSGYWHSMLCLASSYVRLRIPLSEREIGYLDMMTRPDGDGVAPRVDRSVSQEMPPQRERYQQPGATHTSMAGMYCPNCHGPVKVSLS